MKVAVTGAGGFVGLNIISALIEAGHEPVAIIRNTTNCSYLSDLTGNIRKADILDRPALIEAFKGVDSVIHCAGATSNFRSDFNTVWRTNSEGTANVINAIKCLGIKRLIYTSSTCTIGSSKNQEIANESTVLNGFRKHSQYSRSKAFAEKLIFKATDDFETVILNPAEVLGPYDYHFGWGSVIVNLHKNKMPFIPSGGGTFCHSLDVGRAHVAALTKGVHKNRYILGGIDITYNEFFKKIAELTGCRLPKKNPLMSNYLFLKVVFAVNNKIFGKRPPLDPVRLKSFYRVLYFDSSKAESDLGYKTSTIEKMIIDSYNWYLENGYI